MLAPPRPELPPPAGEAPCADEEDDERERTVQAVDPAARLIGVAEKGELRDGHDEERDGEADGAPVPPPGPDRPDHDHELADVHEHREPAVRVERALARPADVRRDRERLDEDADDSDRAADEDQPHRSSSHARDDTTPAGRREPRDRVRTGA